MKNFRHLQSIIGNQKNLFSTRILSLAAIALLSIYGSISPTWADDDFRQRVNQGKDVFSAEDDVKAEIVFGRVLAARVLGKHPFYENDPVNVYVNKLGKGLAQFANRPEIEFRFAVLDTDMVNAFAAPGGYIFITKGALAKMEDEAELAAVLAHEIAHVTERHIVRELNIKGTDASPVSGFAQVLGGGTGAVRLLFTQMVDQAAEILFDKGLKKQDELDSDRVATLMLSAAGYDPTALKRYLVKISKAEKETQVMSGTHPPFADRIKNVSDILAENQLTEKKQAIVKGRFNENVKIN